MKPLQSSSSPKAPYSPVLLASSFSKSSQQRLRLLKQLQQLGLDLSQYQNLSLKQLTIKSRSVMNNTYSIKYLGLNKNQMGIVSRRINPLTDMQLKIKEDCGDTYTVNRYFYPKPLRTGKKINNQKDINVDNLESQIKRQFDENVKVGRRRSKQNRDEKMKTKVLGSWYSASNKSLKGTMYSPKTAIEMPRNIAENIVETVDPTNSFSRFLNKGILIVRD